MALRHTAAAPQSTANCRIWRAGAERTVRAGSRAATSAAEVKTRRVSGAAPSCSGWTITGTASSPWSRVPSIRWASGLNSAPSTLAMLPLIRACLRGSLCGELPTHSTCCREIRVACAEAGSTTISSYCPSWTTICTMALARWRSSTGSCSSSFRLLRVNISRAWSALV